MSLTITIPSPQTIAEQHHNGPPYPPGIWALGGVPNRSVDLPITAVYLAFFVIGAAAHMTIFQLNRIRGHLFLFSAMLFGFCMARTIACIMRIASICKPQNIRLAIAAQIFTAAGTILVFIVNLVFVQRIIRAQHPTWGWNKPFSIFFKVLYGLIIVTLAMGVTATVQYFYTLNTNTRRIDRDIQRYGSTYVTFLSFLPLPLLTISLLVARTKPLDRFGTGRFRTKIIVLYICSFLMCFGSTYRCALLYHNPVPRSQPMPAYYHKAAFYIINFTIEIVVVYMYLFLRVDLRWYVPNKSHGSYTTGSGQKQAGNESPATSTGGMSRIYTEEETFDLMPDPETTIEQSQELSEKKAKGPSENKVAEV